MDTQLSDAETIKQIISHHATFKPSYGDIESCVAFDDEHATYALLETGWMGKKHIHDLLIHVELRDGQIHIQYDGTEGGIADELIQAGVPAQRIVLGFQHPSVRSYTGFAEAR